MEQVRGNNRASGRVAVGVGALGALLIVTPALGLILALDGCDDDKQATDGRTIERDAGGRNCDAEANEWGVRDLGSSAANLDDAGVRANLLAIWGASESAIFAVGTEGRVIFFDGTRWQRQATPVNVDLTAVWGVSPTDVWAVGLAGVVIHFNGQQWSDRSPPVNRFLETDAGAVPVQDAAVAARRNLWGVWVASRTVAGEPETSAVYTAGERGTVLHFKDGVWTRIDSGVEEQLAGVWGTNEDNVYVVGDFGTILRGNAAGFNEEQTGSDQKLRGVWGRNDNDVYVVGLNGTVLHSRGSGWTPIEGAAKQFLRGTWGPPNDRSSVYIVGWDGVLFRLGGGPAFANGGEFNNFNCVSSNRLNGIWGTLVEVPRPIPDAGLPAGVDAGTFFVPRIWVVGVSGTILTGP